MSLIIPANSLAGGGGIDNSLRFNSGSSDYLNRTPATVGNRQICTYSAWIKISDIATERCLISASPNGSNYNGITIGRDSGVLRYFEVVSGVATGDVRTSQLFRDVSAWYHIVVAIDSTQATSSNRIKIYVNGSQVTSFSLNTVFAQNTNTSFGNNCLHTIGRYADVSVGYFNGYHSEVYFIDGQQLTPTDFGEFDADSGVWKPIAYSGTYGTNGFFLEFKDSSALGDDTSGNSNDFTVNNLTSIDQTTDTPTNNFATLNPLANQGTVAFSDGNLSTTITGSSGNASGSIFANKGKWYFECKITNSDNKLAFGIMRDTTIYTTTDIYQVVGTIVYYSGNGQIFDNIPTSSGGVSSAYGSTFTNNDIVSCALDLDNGYLYFAKNGTWQNSGVPTSGATGTGGISIPTDSYFTALLGSVGLTPSSSMNFGNPSFTISSGNADENSIGNFEYAVPSGYLALCTKNLSEVNS